VQDCLEMRELTQSQLMHDLAGLGITMIVPLRRLVFAQNLQCCCRELRVNQCALQGGNQAVASDQRHESGHTSSGHLAHVIGALDRQSQSGHVLHRLGKEPVDLLVAGADLEYRVLPPLHALANTGVKALTRCMPQAPQSGWGRWRKNRGGRRASRHRARARPRS
jgi:hypothetical protein